MRVARLLIAAALGLSTLVLTQQASIARPTHAELESAKARLNDLNDRLDVLVEQYDQAQVALQQSEQDLAEARYRADQADNRADAASRELSARASLAYRGVGSELDVLLGSTSFAQFSDRLEFLNQIAGSDADVIARASVAGQEARWAGRDLARAVQVRQDALNAVSNQRSDIESSVGDQKALIDRLEKELAQPLYPRQSPSSAPSFTLSSYSGPTPVVNGSVQAVLDAAYSVLGVPYVYAGSSPEGGFDCSGLTMWAWAHAGVSLPHSSAMQYASLPHVPLSELQPGDLVFFYSPIHHVGLYIGGGMMIHAPHTGAYVEKIALSSHGDIVGAARP
ncbi:MAG: NlpC/P60 family protein [Actinomycetota bacterium]